MRTWRIAALTLIGLASLSSVAPAQSRRGELRGVLVSSQEVGDWPAFARALRENGFNAVFLDVGSGWAARYPSAVLPVRLGEAGSDSLAEAVTAIRARGLECHAVGFGLEAPGGGEDLVESYREAGRLQRAADGEVVGGKEAPFATSHYLCPSQPDNRKLLQDAAVELAEKYPLTGVQLSGAALLADPETCFCQGCKERFQRQTRVEVADWPRDVQQGGAHAAEWQQWRREVVTTLAEEIADAVRTARPDIVVSVAPIPEVREAYERQGQDWTAWARDGAIDFVCAAAEPARAGEQPALTGQQVAELRGAVPLYAILREPRGGSVWSLIEHVEAARAAGADGFVVSGVSPQAFLDWLPDLRATVASADPNPTPHGHPPARFAFGGEAAKPPASGSRVLAGALLEADLSVGWEPPAPSSEDTAGEEVAGAMLERALGVRDPIDTYEERGPLVAPPGEDRLSGRIVVETTDGASLAVLGAFDSSYQFARTLRFPAPKGPFRLAIYGTVTTGSGPHDFVVRSPLLEGLTEGELKAASRLSEFEELRLYACDAPELAPFAEFAPVLIQVKATGSPEASWWVRFADDGGCETGLGAPTDPDLTFIASIDDYVAAAHGSISADRLFDSGRLRVTGDEKLLSRLADVFMGD